MKRTIELTLSTLFLFSAMSFGAQLLPNDELRTQRTYLIRHAAQNRHIFVGNLKDKHYYAKLAKNNTGAGLTSALPRHPLCHFWIEDSGEPGYVYLHHSAHRTAKSLLVDGGRGGAALRWTNGKGAPSAGRDYFKWKFIPLGKGLYHIQNKKSGRLLWAGGQENEAVRLARYQRPPRGVKNPQSFEARYQWRVDRVIHTKIHPHQWQLIPRGGNRGGQIHPESAYNWKSTANRRFLIYKKRRFGINLDFSKSQGKVAFVFERRNRKDRSPLKYLERVALRVPGVGYIHYKKRKWGINLVWSNKPKYEWWLTGGPRGVLASSRSAPVGIFNEVVGDYVVHQGRLWGVDLRWWKDAIRELRNEEEYLRRRWGKRPRGN